MASLRQSNHAFGPNCVALQEEFAAWNGNKYCAASNSGTAALHMGLAACEVGCGDEVITTTLSWTSSATCIMHHNAIPVFVDIDWDTQLIDPEKIEAAITPKTRPLPCIIGIPCDGCDQRCRNISSCYEILSGPRGDVQRQKGWNDRTLRRL